jgi:hypothetical protein
VDTTELGLTGVVCRVSADDPSGVADDPSGVANDPSGVADDPPSPAIHDEATAVSVSPAVGDGSNAECGSSSPVAGGGSNGECESVGEVARAAPAGATTPTVAERTNSEDTRSVLQAVAVEGTLGTQNAGDGQSCGSSATVSGVDTRHGSQRSTLATVS